MASGLSINNLKNSSINFCCSFKLIISLLNNSLIFIPKFNESKSFIIWLILANDILVSDKFAI